MFWKSITMVNPFVATELYQTQFILLILYRRSLDTFYCMKIEIESKTFHNKALN